MLWQTSWANLMMDLASIPTYKNKDKEEDAEIISPENEQAELRKTLGL